jgi:hypothetical protein
MLGFGAGDRDNCFHSPTAWERVPLNPTYPAGHCFGWIGDMSTTNNVPKFAEKQSCLLFKPSGRFYNVRKK